MDSSQVHQMHPAIVRRRREEVAFGVNGDRVDVAFCLQWHNVYDRKRLAIQHAILAQIEDEHVRAAAYMQKMLRAVRRMEAH